MYLRASGFAALSTVPVCLKQEQEMEKDTKGWKHSAPLKVELTPSHPETAH